MDIFIKTLLWIALASFILSKIARYVKNKQRASAVAAGYERRFYRWIATDDLAMVNRAASDEGFRLRIIKVSKAWTTLHLTPREEYLLNENCITLLR